MAKIPNTAPQTGVSAPYDALDTYAVGDEKYQRIFFKGYADLTERNADTLDRRKNSMHCFVVSTGKYYKLTNNPNVDSTQDTDWTEIEFGGGATSYYLLNSSFNTLVANGVLKFGDTYFIYDKNILNFAISTTDYRTLYPSAGSINQFNIPPFVDTEEVDPSTDDYAGYRIYQNNIYLATVATTGGTPITNSDWVEISSAKSEFGKPWEPGVYNKYQTVEKNGFYYQLVSTGSSLDFINSTDFDAELAANKWYFLGAGIFLNTLNDIGEEVVSGPYFTIKLRGNVEQVDNLINFGETYLNVTKSQLATLITNSEIKKGYTDVTHLVSVQLDTNDKEISYVSIKDNLVDKFMNLMKQYTDGLVKQTYSVKAKNVTEAQILAAQTLIDELSKINKSDESSINKKLIELYTVIPRFIKDTRKHILPNIDLDKCIVQEQDNLDAMRSQVQMNVAEDVSKSEPSTILDALGISMNRINVNDKLNYLINQIKSTRYSVKGIFEVNKPKENTIYDNWIEKQKNKDSRYLIHGTRCTSVIPIMKEGLKIRPSGNFQFSGKVYGDGNYFSEVVDKSLNYTGYDNDKILLVYEVHTGNPFTYNGWYKGNDFPLNYKELSSRGFDSTYVKAGNGLLNSEIIAYNEQQSRLKFVIWLG